MASTAEHDVHINASTGDLRAATERLKADDGERQKLLQDPVSYLAGMGIQLRGATAEAVRQRSGSLAASPRMAGIVHIDV